MESKQNLQHKINLMKKHFNKLCFLIIFCFIVQQSVAQRKEKDASIVKSGQYFEIKVGNNVMQIDPARGGRIRSLRHGRINFLTDSSVNSFNYGSTFWLSPQSNWKWPPSAEIDNKPYIVEFQRNSLKLTSQRDEKTGIVVQKEFSSNENHEFFVIKYTLTNNSSQLQKVAPWEVTRVHTNGIAFFPMGKGSMRGGLLPLMILRENIAWFSYDTSRLPGNGDRQIYSDGAEGWLAELNGRWLLVQKSPRITVEKTAPNEGEIELYASPIKNGIGYVEIEHQGEYSSLVPGASTTWEVHWYLRKIPENIKTSAGNAELVRYVRKMIK